MKRFYKSTVIHFFFSSLLSCKKNPNEVGLTPAEIQKTKEQNEVLLPNELLEHEGLRFKINYPPGTAQIGLKLYKDSPAKSEIPLSVTTEFENYSIESKKLDDNSDFILLADYKSVTNDGVFALEVIGFTSMNLSKEFTLDNNLYTKASGGTEKAFLKIRKG